MATDVSAPLPELNLERKSILTVDTGDVNATITRLVIHFSQDVPEAASTVPLVPPQFVYGESA